MLHHMKHTLGRALILRGIMEDTLRDAEAIDDWITVRIPLARQRNRAGQSMLIERESFPKQLRGPFSEHLIHEVLNSLIYRCQVLSRQLLQLALNHPDHFAILRRPGIEIHP